MNSQATQRFSQTVIFRWQPIYKLVTCHVKLQGADILDLFWKMLGPKSYFWLDLTVTMGG